MYFRLRNLLKYINFTNYLPSLLLIDKIHNVKNNEKIYTLSNYNHKILKIELKNKRIEHMSLLWSSIKNPPIPSPIPFYSKFPKQELPILVMDSTRSLRMLLLHKFPGAPVKCKLCHELIHSYLSHRSKCIALPDDYYDKFLEIDGIKNIDWIYLNNKTYIYNFITEIRYTFSG